MIDRYEFEILNAIADRAIDSNQVRTLSDRLHISGTKVSESIDKLRNKNYILNDMKTLSISEEGLKCLETYRVKKAIILAAGFGSRMMPATSDKPKPMVTVNGKRIIETLLDALISSDITDITIVGGYKVEVLYELRNKYSTIKIVDNPLYESENNISSIMQVLDELNERCYVCEADLYISNPNVITKYQYCSNFLSSYALETDDWCFDVEKGYITNYRKGGKYCFNYYGISCWTPQDCQMLREDYRKYYAKTDGKDLFWEFVPIIQENEKYHVEIRLCQKEDIMEIDNYYELAQLDSSY